jgi:hypothetical protein
MSDCRLLCANGRSSSLELQRAMPADMIVAVVWAADMAFFLDQRCHARDIRDYPQVVVGRMQAVSRRIRKKKKNKRSIMVIY